MLEILVSNTAFSEKRPKVYKIGCKLFLDKSKTEKTNHDLVHPGCWVPVGDATTSDMAYFGTPPPQTGFQIDCLISGQLLVKIFYVHLAKK